MAKVFLVTSPMKVDVSPYVTAEFDGEVLRTRLNGTIVDTRSAKIGELFFIYPRKKSPKVTRANMPAERGQKIAWAISFTDESSRVSSLEEFENHIANMPVTSGKGNITIQRRKYAFWLSENSKGQMHPELAFVSDDISANEVRNLINEYTIFGKLFCPKDFIYLL